MSSLCRTGRRPGAHHPDRADPAVGDAAFHAWFTGSRIVDDQGQPLSVYHGTRQTFDRFRNSNPDSQWGPGIYFSHARDDAWMFGDGQEGQGDVRIMTAHLRMLRPLYGAGDGILDEIATLTKATRWDAIYRDLQVLGHDGLVITYPGGEAEFVAFRPDQIHVIDGG